MSKVHADIADELDLDDKLAYRLLRALSSLGFSKEQPDYTGFSITPQGELLRKDHLTNAKRSNIVRRGPEHMPFGNICRQ